MWVPEWQSRQLNFDPCSNLIESHSKQHTKVEFVGEKNP
jgi:hypothetical protein